MIKMGDKGGRRWERREKKGYCGGSAYWWEMRKLAGDLLLRVGG